MNATLEPHATPKPVHEQLAIAFAHINVVEPEILTTFVIDKPLP